MAINLTDNIKVNAPKPSDPRYFAPDNTPWASIEAVEAGIPLTERHPELTVDVMGVEYWWKDGAWELRESNLVHKTGNETIAGVKTFTDNLRINGAGLLVNSTDNETGNIVIVDTDEYGFPYIRLGLTASENTAELRIDNINTNSIFQFPNETGTFALKETSVNFKSKSTYASMIADGTPTVPTMYSITNDENKGYERSTYLWKPDGNREWIASTPDN